LLSGLCVDRCFSQFLHNPPARDVLRQLNPDPIADQHAHEVAIHAIGDAAIEQELPAGSRAIVFRLLSESAIADLRRREEALTAPSISE